MTRFLKFLLAAALSAFLFCTASAAPSLISESAVLMDAETGQVLYDKNMHVQKHPASITKIATVICGLENGSLTDKITMSENAVFSVSRNSSHIALDVGEELTLEEASYAALLVSANEACNGIAEHCGGTIENFVSMMNETARAAGAKNTTFVNANGLRDPNHLTTAYDMACITRYALRNDDFRKIFGTYKYTMAPTNEQPEERLFVNQHYMISDPSLLYDGFVGGKVGYTTDALCTLVTAAERDGRTLIAVVMRSPRDYDRYTDTKALLDYGFESFHTLTVTKADLPSDKDYRLEKNIEISIENNISLSDLTITAKEVAGEHFIVVSAPTGEELASVPCTVADTQTVRTFTPPPKSDKKRSPLAVLGLVVLAIIGLLIFLILLLLLAIIIRKKIYRARRRRRRRRMQQMQQRRR
ncbi:MAG: D-alanyl-D-alanine carboxypeptidase [Oscillospiraceae bacterium]|nr:D-alanyl-D-alanine carboxypeptidase [Oscillospiraceae bacterium]